MRFVVIILFILYSCNEEKKPITFWETQRNNFRYQDKKEFIIDSSIWENYKSLMSSRHPMFDSIVSGPVYLYSWQQRAPENIEFTVLKDRGEHGLSILYFIVDNNGKIISWEQVAGKGYEGGYSFETFSRVLNKDTLIHAGAITQLIDFNTLKKMARTKGDTSFYYLTIDKSGKFNKQQYKEIKEINFDEGD